MRSCERCSRQPRANESCSARCVVVGCGFGAHRARSPAQTAVRGLLITLRPSPRIKIRRAAPSRKSTCEILIQAHISALLLRFVKWHSVPSFSALQSIRRPWRRSRALADASYWSSRPLLLPLRAAIDRSSAYVVMYKFRMVCLVLSQKLRHYPDAAEHMRQTPF